MRRLLPILFILSLNVSAASPPAESFARLNTAFPDLVFIDPAGNPARLSDYRGKVVMVKLWATWCGVCRKKWPAHQALYDALEHEPGVEIITLSVFEDQQTSRDWVRQQGFGMPLYENPLVDRAAVRVTDGSYFFIKGTPMTFLIDKSGRLRQQSIGTAAAISEADIRDLI